MWCDSCLCGLVNAVVVWTVIIAVGLWFTRSKKNKP